MDALLNPTTADYAGKRTQSLANAVYLRLQTPLGSYWADPELGSRLHELQREKDTPRVRRLAIQYAEQALQPLLDDRRATAITVSTVDYQPGWIALLIEVTDSTGDTQHFKHPVKVS
ncbi:phage GP46 family protein [Burkholderia vietnamiensis]|uniref:phage GP46 family protein n=1 Tax=Burkholderia vietnamiensis TaxID=60552 RepID=UPI00158F6256|nr:phage GP46 family protein [Burkholderia vietnamiensis]MCA8183837.1 phage GP46 family protein [Burkholderia vietnamiensis]